MGLPYYCDCVGWPREDVHAEGGLCDMQSDARSVTRRTLLKHVDKAAMRQLEASLGYRRGELTMAQDYHVGYYRSKLHGKRVYYVKHSGIELVFHDPGTKHEAPRPHLARFA